MTGPDLAVVVVNWRRPRETAECCHRLLAWQRLQPQVIVVDNGSPDDVRRRLRDQLPGVLFLSSETNRGFGAANNMALAEVRAPFVLLLNNDAEIEADDTLLLLDFLGREPRAGIVGPVLEATEPPHSVLAAGGRDILLHGRTHLRAGENTADLAQRAPFEVAYVPGTAALVRTELLHQLGGLEESYFFSGEMADLGRRALEAGFASFIVPQARARHDLTVASDLRQSLYAYYSLRNRFLFARRHGHPAAPHLVHWAARGALSSSAALLRGEGRTARFLARAVSDGLAGRFGPAGFEFSS